MANHAQPREIAELKGAVEKNPQRYKGYPPKLDMPLGDAPLHISESAQSCWFELSAFSPPGVLTGAERIPMELASNLLAEYRESPCDFQVGKYTHLIGLLARFGMTPSDRQKLSIAKEEEADDFETL